MIHLIRQLIKEKGKNFRSFDDVTKKSDEILSKLLNYVYTHSVFYHDLYSKQGIGLKIE